MVAVATGADWQAERLGRELGLVCLLDPDRRLYRALGIRRVRPWEWLTWRMWRRYLRAFVDRYLRRRHRRARQGRITGDPTQLPGVLVLDPAGRVVYLHRGEALGDYPPVGEVVAAAQAAARSEGVSPAGDDGGSGTPAPPGPSEGH